MSSDVMSAAALQRQRIERLRALGAVLVPLPLRETRALLRRFREAFVDPAQQDEHARALEGGRAIEHQRFLRADSVRPLAPQGSSLAWLTSGSARMQCHRIEREPWLPAVHLVPGSVEETWVASWPGVFVSLDAGRALVVTLDYERIYCDLRGRSPYR